MVNPWLKPEDKELPPAKREFFIDVPKGMADDEFIERLKKAFKEGKINGCHGIIYNERELDPSELTEEDQKMIAESRRLAKLGKYRPMQEFIDERRNMAP